MPWKECHAMDERSARKVPLREPSARTRPRTMSNRMAAPSAVVPVHTITQVVCDTHIVTPWIDITSKNVDDSLVTVAHTPHQGMKWAGRKQARFDRGARKVRSFGNGTDANAKRERRLAPRAGLEPATLRLTGCSRLSTLLILRACSSGAILLIPRVREQIVH
jgi:hypothetical protein